MAALKLADALVVRGLRKRYDGNEVVAGPVWTASKSDRLTLIGVVGENATPFGSTKRNTV